MNETIFFFSHTKQIKWISVLAEACKEQFIGCKVILFVHGAIDKKYAQQFHHYDEVVDLIDGFQYKKVTTSDSLTVSKELTQLEDQLDISFFWSDAMVDRWIRAKNDASFTIQYLNFAFERLNYLYNLYNPIFGVGESTAAIYRFAHRLFDRDKRFYIVPNSTRYFKRFYLETDWDLIWKDMGYYYHKFLQEGIPSDLRVLLDEHHTNITQKHNKPLSFEEFSKNHKYGVKKINWLDIRKYVSSLKNLFLISHADNKNNIQYATNAATIYQKIKRLLHNKQNIKCFEMLSSQIIPEKIKFCVYFLHYSPEYIIDSLGRFYRNQQHLIANIAASLPSDYVLLVKEHSPMVGLRNKDFYKEVIKNNNVLLLHSSIDSHQLIKQAGIVFTIAGTAALEAMVMQKPAIVFGKYAFSNTNLISFCSNFWDLAALVREKLNMKVDEDEALKHSLAIIAAKYKASSPGVLPFSCELVDSFMDDFDNLKKIKFYFKQELIRLKISSDMSCHNAGTLLEKSC